MKNILIAFRNALIGFFYAYLLKPLFFLRDPEDVHDHMTKFGKVLGKFWLTRQLAALAFNYSNSILEQNILGINFKNPVGLAAGFDKNAELTNIIPYTGFGFEEIGSITGEACKGNPKPRLWRLKESLALVVYYGLKNDGAEKISTRLKNKSFKIPIGVNIAKTNCAETVGVKEGIADYVKAFRAFENIGDYYTINISCPNTFGGEPFQNADKLDLLLTEIDKYPTKKPIFLKIAPDLSEKQVDAIIEISHNHHVSGFICTNLAKERDRCDVKEKDIPLVGSISGKVVWEASNRMLSYLYQKTKGRYVLIGVGGIFTAEDAYEKIRLGASLVQLITGMIFLGPQSISEINRGLVRLLKKDGYTNISEAIGSAHKNA